MTTDFLEALITRSQKKVCTVILPREVKHLYQDAIISACQDSDLQATLIADELGLAPAIRQIHDAIGDNAFVVTEITTSNPNVFYELGMSVGYN